MQLFIVLAVLTLSAAGAPTSSSTVHEEKWSVSGPSCSSSKSTINGVTVESTVCEQGATWRLNINGNCNISTYYKKTVTVFPEPASTQAYNGVAQCTKTPCDATEKISVDCATAFGYKLSLIEK